MTTSHPFALLQPGEGTLCTLKFPHYFPFSERGDLSGFPFSRGGDLRLREGPWLIRGRMSHPWHCSGQVCMVLPHPARGPQLWGEENRGQAGWVRKLPAGWVHPECQEGCSEKPVEGPWLGKSLPCR